MLIAVLAIYKVNAASSSPAAKKSTNKAATPGVHLTVKVAPEHLSPVEQILNSELGIFLNSSSRDSKAEALKTMLPYIASLPDPDARLMWEAAVWSGRKDYEKAGALLSKVRNFDHGSYYCKKLAAKTCVNLMKTDLGIELATLALKTNKDEEVLAMRASCYLTKGRYNDAAKDYIEAANMDYWSMNYARAASCYLKNNEPAKALVYLDKSWEGASEADKPNCCFAKGVILQHLNRQKEAAAAFTDGIVRNAEEIKKHGKRPQEDYGIFLTNCLAERAKCYDKLGMTAEAEKDRKKRAELAKKVEQDLFGKN